MHTRISFTAAAVLAIAALPGCGERNTLQPPPPAEVTVATPVQRSITRYLELTGQTAPSRKVDLVARVQGVLETVGFKDGADVAEGEVLFRIESASYETSLKISEASVAQQQALLAQTEGDFARKANLAQRQVASEAMFDDSRAKRDQAAAQLKQAQGNVDQARLNLGYTTITAPFAGRISARAVDAGSLVGAGGPTRLATLVQMDPIYVNFSINEQQVLQIRQSMRDRGVTLKDVGPVPVEIGLQTEAGYPHAGVLDYVSPDLDAGTGTLAVRATIANKDGVLLPGLFVRVRLLVQRNVAVTLVPDRAIGTSQRGPYVLVVDGANKVQQKDVETAEQVDGGLRIVTKGLDAKDRVVVGGIQRAAPGAVVAPVVQAAGKVGTP